MIRDYAEVDENGRVLQCLHVEDPEEGPPTPTYSNHTCYWLEKPIDWGSQPTATSVLMWEDGGPVWKETATFEDLKVAKRAEINTSRLKANKTSFTFAGKEIAADELSMLDIQITHGGIVRRGTLREGWPGGWKTIDNTYVAILDVETWYRFYDAIESTGQANFNKAQALKKQLEEATTVEEVDAIKW